MVVLVTDYPQQINMLEWLLITNHIKYEVNIPRNSSFKRFIPPFLIVDGVPLDSDRSLKWITDKIEEVKNGH